MPSVTASLHILLGPCTTQVYQALCVGTRFGPQASHLILTAEPESPQIF